MAPKKTGAMPLLPGLGPAQEYLFGKVVARCGIPLFYAQILMLAVMQKRRQLPTKHYYFDKTDSKICNFET
jgi:hypothetical protein